MPNGLNLGKVSCITCPLCCEIKPNASLRVSLCQSYCFCTWPEDNSYFSLGIIEGVLKKTHSYLYTGCIFVDFSISYLHVFLEKKWLDYLLDSKLNIILVCDRYLQPLANHWFKRVNGVFLVVYPTDNLAGVSEKIKKRFNGQSPMTVEGNTLSTMEFNVLQALFSGRDCLHVARFLDVDIRSIYAAKQRVEKKMGADINNLLRFSLTA